MKKCTKVTIGILGVILILFLLTLIAYFIDLGRVNSNKKPIFVVKSYETENLGEYKGAFYTVAENKKKGEYGISSLFSSNIKTLDAKDNYILTLDENNMVYMVPTSNMTTIRRKLTKKQGILLKELLIDYTVIKNTSSNYMSDYRWTSSIEAGKENLHMAFTGASIFEIHLPNVIITPNDKLSFRKLLDELYPEKDYSDVNAY